MRMPGNEETPIGSLNFNSKGMGPAGMSKPAFPKAAKPQAAWEGATRGGVGV